MLSLLQKTKTNDDNLIKTILFSCSIVFIVVACLIEHPITITTGLQTIMFHSSKLITDYVAIAGWGASLFNAGFLMLITISIICLQKVPITGNTITITFWMGGFGMFGKNIVNIWPILLGTLMYCKFTNTKFSQYMYIAFFGTALAPLISEVTLWTNHYMLGVMVGIIIGFILPTIAIKSLQMHHGYNLYNVGFAAGLIGFVLVSIMRSFGYIAEVSLFWYEQYTIGVPLFIYGICIIFLIIGYVVEPSVINKYKQMIVRKGRLTADFIALDGVAVVLFNMGLLGIVYTSFIVSIGMPLNGATIGCIMAIIGFGASGKHLKNTIPIVIGVIIATLVGEWNIYQPAVLLAVLFATALAPVVDAFGWGAGVVAGFIHLSLVSVTGSWHGWTNLYNNGLSAGIVAISLVPIIEMLKEEVAKRQLQSGKMSNEALPLHYADGSTSMALEIEQPTIPHNIFISHDFTSTYGDKTKNVSGVNEQIETGQEGYWVPTGDNEISEEQVSDLVSKTIDIAKVTIEDHYFVLFPSRLRRGEG